MSRVSTGEGIKYGFSLLGYLVAVSLVAFVVVAIGAGMAGRSVENGTFGEAILGALVVLAGVLIFYAGFIGTVYKVIVDGVTTALERTDAVAGDEGLPRIEPNRDAADHEGRNPPRDAPAGTAPQGGPRSPPPDGSEYPAEERRVQDRPPRNEETGGGSPRRSSEPVDGGPDAGNDEPAANRPTGGSELACPECGASNREGLDNCWKCGIDLSDASR